MCRVPKFAYLVALYPVAVDHQHLARTYVPYELAVMHINSHTLARHDIPIPILRFDLSETEWLEAKRIPDSNQRLIDQHHE